MTHEVLCASIEWWFRVCPSASSKHVRSLQTGLIFEGEIATIGQRSRDECILSLSHSNIMNLPRIFSHQALFLPFTRPRVVRSLLCILQDRIETLLLGAEFAMHLAKKGIHHPCITSIG
jgi:hypothetical protein